MGRNNREIETKFWTPLPFRKVVATFRECLPIGPVKAGTDLDWYWPAPNPARADFIRYRVTNGQLTVKHTDRGTIRDRVEIDVPVQSCEGQLRQYLLQVHGQPAVVRKNFVIYRVWDTEYSPYKVEGVPGTFIEVESASKAKNAVARSVVRRLIPGVVEQVHSLYEIVVRGKGVRETEVTGICR